jgi:hypothetical protein
MAWHTEGLKTNPTEGTLMADTGATPAGSYAVGVLAAGTVLTTIRLEYRDSSNTSNNASQILKVQANSTVQVTLPVYLADDERVRAVMDADAGGKCQVSLFLA